MTRKTDPLCDCGKPLHYRDKATEDQVHREVRDNGSHVILMDDAGRRWRVQRHWYALHGPFPLAQLKNLGLKEIK